ncbi:hypothetical protein C8R44DRAFT_551331, partial [Mycena epipterygia]
MTSRVAGPSSGTPAPNQPPPRTKKTHTSSGVIKALKALPSALKHTKNSAIEARNAERNLKHAKHLEQPANYSDASDEESLITVSDAE